MVVTAAKEEEVEASVEFLKWFVRAENNIAFSVGSGYLPVTRKANDMQEILAAADRETVVQRIAEGRSAAEAEAEFLTDEYFEAWYQDICAKLAQYEG